MCVRPFSSAFNTQHLDLLASASVTTACCAAAISAHRNVFSTSCQHLVNGLSTACQPLFQTANRQEPRQQQWLNQEQRQQAQQEQLLW
eukprot:1767-Heterococcus_DN1.PRE.5